MGSSRAASTSALSLARTSIRSPTNFFLFTIFGVFGYLGQLPLWLVYLVISRDAMIVGAVVLSTIMGNPVKMHPLMVSKVNTAAQIVLAAFVLAISRSR